MKTKKILYLDMDGVLADFDKSINEYIERLELNVENFDGRDKLVDYICENHPLFFQDLEPIDGAIESVKKLFEIYDVYFLSSPMWWVPESFTGKRIWIEKHFGELAVKKLILTHRKDLNIGHYLVDDRLKNGVLDFKGLHIHFGTEMFPDWKTTYHYLVNVANL